MTAPDQLPGLELVLGTAGAVTQGRLAGAGPAGRLPLTPAMLLGEPSGNLFGLTQNVGMGWSPDALGGAQVVIAPLGGLRGEGGTPIAPAITGPGDRPLVREVARRAQPWRDPVQAYVSDPCDGRTQGDRDVRQPGYPIAATVMRRSSLSPPRTASSAWPRATRDCPP
jgi:hypothetical protein